MSFVSMGFLLFLLAGLVVYYVIPKKYQWIWLLVLSYAFYISYGIKSIIFILFTTATTFVGALVIEHIDKTGKQQIKEQKSLMSAAEKKAAKAKIKHKKRQAAAVILVLNFGLLAFLKYYNFTAENLNILFFNLHTDVRIRGLRLLLPLGISFYTFQSMGYLIDVYQGKYEAERHFFKFSLFVSFFPQILQGPIGRYNRLSSQLYEKHSFDLQNIQFGLQLMFWGFFKKLVLADRANVIVMEVFDHVGKYHGIPVVIGVFAYCIQLYGDFSGGMDVVMGAAQMFGIRLDENFARPFFSHSISEFWRRWHITLGTWMKDYVFYPFSLSKQMNRFGKFAKKKFGNTIGRVLPICVADLLIFFLVGVWHGAAWKFIMYGMYNGMIIAVSSLLEPVYQKAFLYTHINRESRVWKLFQVFRTFVLVNIGWYFDRANSLKDAFALMKNTVTGFSMSVFRDGTMLQLGSGLKGYIILLAGCLLLFIVSLLQEKGIKIRELVAAQKMPVRFAVYLSLVFLVLTFGKIATNGGGFIYAQF